MKLIFISLYLLSVSLLASSGDKEVFDKMLSHYEIMGDAFFKNDLKTVNQVAKELVKESKGLKEEKVLEVMKPTMTFLNSLTSEVKVDKAHKDFNVVSRNFLTILEKHLPNKSYGKYYCPMVQKYWIQNVTKNEKVMNPYAADTMPHCGGRIEE